VVDISREEAEEATNRGADTIRTTKGSSILNKTSLLSSNNLLLQNRKVEKRAKKRNLFLTLGSNRPQSHLYLKDTLRSQLPSPCLELR
jgi:hypothetical protein